METLKKVPWWGWAALAAVVVWWWWHRRMMRAAAAAAAATATATAPATSTTPTQDTTAPGAVDQVGGLLGGAGNTGFVPPRYWLPPLGVKITPTADSGGPYYSPYPRTTGIA